MDLWRLQIFCRVIENRSFSKAGKSVSLSQPTVSSHIKDLESHFGCRLIDRMGREALPTQAGDILYTYARKLLLLRDETEAALAAFQGAMRGRLLIGGSTIPGGYLLPKMIGQFSKAYPEVRVSLTIEDTEQITQRILTGRIELGIVGAKSSDARIDQQPLVMDEMRLMVPRGHRWGRRKDISLDQLKEEPFIIRESGSGTRKSIEGILSSAGSSLRELSIIAEMGNTVAVIQGIKSGVGVSILSTTAVAEELENRSLKALEIKGFQLNRYLYLVRHGIRTLSPLGEAFHRFLCERTC